MTDEHEINRKVFSTMAKVAVNEMQQHVDSIRAQGYEVDVHMTPDGKVEMSLRNAEREFHVRADWD